MRGAVGAGKEEEGGTPTRLASARTRSRPCLCAGNTYTQNTFHAHTRTPSPTFTYSTHTKLAGETIGGL